jgi:hypothetical protein
MKGNRSGPHSLPSITAPHTLTFPRIQAVEAVLCQAPGDDLEGREAARIRRRPPWPPVGASPLI